MIRLFVADDHPIVREGLKSLVATGTGMVVVGEAADGDKALEALHDKEADVLLLDVSMPGPGVLELIRRLQAGHPRLRILVLSVHSEEQYAVRVLRAGAAGYLMKDRTPEELIDAIRKIHSGGRYVTESLAEKLAFDLLPNTDSEPHEQLSDREYQVLTSLATGMSSKEIAGNLSLSPKTVATYRSRILQKLDLETTAELIRYAVERELIPGTR
jgi:DNA-binding NarL/FixJ family response regulator